MRVLVLGCGLQGRAVLQDLACSPCIDAVVCADASPDHLDAAISRYGSDTVVGRIIDARDPANIDALLSDGFDVIIDMLPRQFVRLVAEAAIRSQTHLVNTFYDDEIRDLADAAKDAGIAMLPEMGLDPGIDLLMAAEAVRRFERVTHLASYGAGIPEPGADDNPLRYRISWTWEGVLAAYSRPARVIRHGDIVDIDRDSIFDEDNTHQLDLPPFGALEAYANGDAVKFAERFGIANTLIDSGRYALRWPGHCQTWRVLSKLGFLSEEPSPRLRGMSPREVLVKHLEPLLQYEKDQRDCVILRVEASGEGGERDAVVLEMLDYLDTDSGLMAMNRTVGFPASIAAQMIVNGSIRERGLLHPDRNLPWQAFTRELARRDIHITDSWA